MDEENELGENVTIVKYLKLNDEKIHPIADVKNRENIDKFASNVKQSVSVESEFDSLSQDYVYTLDIEIGNIDYINISQ